MTGVYRYNVCFCKWDRRVLDRWGIAEMLEDARTSDLSLRIKKTQFISQNHTRTTYYPIYLFSLDRE
jgi:hypothetical protein